jgi:hypothetical protein
MTRNVCYIPLLHPFHPFISFQPFTLTVFPPLQFAHSLVIHSSPSSFLPSFSLKIFPLLPLLHSFQIFTFFLPLSRTFSAIFYFSPYRNGSTHTLSRQNFVFSQNARGTIRKSVKADSEITSY